jgi:hypothetical protein
MAKTLIKIFAGALAIRWAYSGAIFLMMGNDGLLGADSPSYVDAGNALAQAITSGTLQGWNWLGTNPYIMPLYTWIVGADALLADSHAVLVHVLVQGVFDAGTCVLVCAMAGLIDPRFAVPAGVAAAINPTQIVVAGLLYPDTAFVFFVALWLYGALRWIKSPTWGSALLITAGLAMSAWVRVLVAPFAPVLLIVLGLALIIKRRFERRHSTQLASAFAIFVVCLAPISIRNETVLGSWGLTPQGGMHLARWVVPLLWEDRDGKPWDRGYAEMEARADAVPHRDDETAFQQSDRYTKVATEELKRIGIVSIAKGWAIGAALNVGTPAVILSPPVSHLPRTGFYGTHGQTIVEKVVAFMFRSDNALYAWVLLAGVAGLAVVRLLQLAGWVVMLGAGEWMAAGVLTLWCLFILAVNGPVASPKYRLPMEPALAVLTGAGWSLLRRRKTLPPDQA